MNALQFENYWLQTLDQVDVALAQRVAVAQLVFLRTAPEIPLSGKYTKQRKKVSHKIE